MTKRCLCLLVLLTIPWFRLVAGGVPADCDCEDKVTAMQNRINSTAERSRRCNRELNRCERDRRDCMDTLDKERAKDCEPEVKTVVEYQPRTVYRQDTRWSVGLGGLGGRDSYDVLAVAHKPISRNWTLGLQAGYGVTRTDYEGVDYSMGGKDDPCWYHLVPDASKREGFPKAGAFLTWKIGR